MDKEVKIIDFRNVKEKESKLFLCILKNQGIYIKLLINLK